MCELRAPAGSPGITSGAVDIKGSPRTIVPRAQGLSTPGASSQGALPWFQGSVLPSPGGVSLMGTCRASVALGLSCAGSGGLCPLSPPPHGALSTSLGVSSPQGLPSACDSDSLVLGAHSTPAREGSLHRATGESDPAALKGIWSAWTSLVHSPRQLTCPLAQLRPGTLPSVTSSVISHPQPRLGPAQDGRAICAQISCSLLDLPCVFSVEKDQPAPLQPQGVTRGGPLRRCSWPRRRPSP